MAAQSSRQRSNPQQRRSSDLSGLATASMDASSVVPPATTENTESPDIADTGLATLFGNFKLFGSPSNSTPSLMPADNIDFSQLAGALASDKSDPPLTRNADFTGLGTPFPVPDAEVFTLEPPGVPAVDPGPKFPERRASDKLVSEDNTPAEKFRVSSVHSLLNPPGTPPNLTLPTFPPFRSSPGLSTPSHSSRLPQSLPVASSTPRTDNPNPVPPFSSNPQTPQTRTYPQPFSISTPRQTAARTVSSAVPDSPSNFLIHRSISLNSPPHSRTASIPKQEWIPAELPPQQSASADIKHPKTFFIPKTAPGLAGDAPGKSDMWQNTPSHMKGRFHVMPIDGHMHPPGGKSRTSLIYLSNNNSPDTTFEENIFRCLRRDNTDPSAGENRPEDWLRDTVLPRFRSNTIPTMQDLIHLKECIQQARILFPTDTRTGGKTHEIVAALERLYEAGSQVFHFKDVWYACHSVDVKLSEAVSECEDQGIPVAALKKVVEELDGFLVGM